ncbi:hypothetical protein MRB53_038424 [Persea americana]|nr:hypothetical protein MRB53_038424 [Persea americana]
MSLDDDVSSPKDWTDRFSQIRSMSSSGPSGIAQLRRSADQSTATASESMKLDDLIVSNSISSPAGLSRSPSAERVTQSGTRHAASAIPMKKQAALQAEDYPLSRASAPSVNPLATKTKEEEFGYVQRRVRKTAWTSERSVSRLVCPARLMVVNNNRPANVQQSIRPKYRRSIMPLFRPILHQKQLSTITLSTNIMSNPSIINPPWALPIR